METNLTKDPAYDAADPGDFPAMLDVERYGKRSGAFDKIISATHDHKMLDVSDRIFHIRDGQLAMVEDREPAPAPEPDSR